MEKNFQIRDKATHEQNCKLVEEDLSGSASKEHGINRNSILNQLTHFHVCDGSLLPDIMHDLLEGVLQYEAKLMLQTFVNDKKYFTLEEFNSRLENLELGYTESKNRPTLISHKTFNSESNSLKQNGLCSMCTLMRNYICLHSITNESLGACVTSDCWRFCS